MAIDICLTLETVLYIYTGLIALGGVLLGSAITSFVNQMRFLKDDIARIDEDIKELERKADEPFQKGEIKDREGAEQEIEKFKKERQDKTDTKENMSPFNVVVLPASSFLLGIGASIYGILKYPKLGPVSMAFTYWQISLGLILFGVATLTTAYRLIWKSSMSRKPWGPTSKPILRILPGIRCFLQSVHFQEYSEASVKTIMIEVGSTQPCELKIKTYDHIPSVTEHVVFDIANDSLFEITAHECRAYMEHPKKIEFNPIMLFDESDLANARKDMRPPKRRLLRPKERVTIQSDLAGRGVYRFDLYTTELENSRYFMFLRGPNWIAFCDSDQRITESMLERAEKESNRAVSSTPPA